MSLRPEGVSGLATVQSSLDRLRTASISAPGRPPSATRRSAASRSTAST